VRRQSPNHSEISSNALVSKYHYGLRLDGKRYSVTESGPATNGATTNYTYDDQGKLTEEAGPYADIRYGYDNVGNRLTRTVTGSTTALLPNGATNTAYDVNDRIVGHTYDLNGNETTVNGQAASYDFENHLVSLGSVASYVYDADGNRYSAASGGATTSYVVDTSLPYASVVEEYSSTTLVARYDYGDDLIRVDHGTAASYYLFDGLGSTRQFVNTSGTVTDTWGYSAFGELTSHTGTTANPFLFNAQQFDQASGDYYLRARYYDQSSGRFISQDPYSGSNDDPITLHRYLYAGGDPVNYADPGGRDFTLSGLAISVAIGATLGGISAGTASYALTGNWSWKAVGVGALAGAAFGGGGYALAAFAPTLAAAAGAFGTGFGFGSSLSLVAQVFNNPKATTGQKLAAVGLLIASVAGPAAGNKAAKLWKAFSNQKQLAKLLEDEPAPGPTGCFVAGTLVQMADGSTKAIELIKIGDKVLTRNPKTGKTETKTVTKTTVHTVRGVYVIGFTDIKTHKVVETITATPNHPFFVHGKGFVTVEQLGIGTQIVTRAGPTIVLSSKKYQSAKAGYVVYNLVVSHDHTYFVGNFQGGLWVHNTGCYEGQTEVPAFGDDGKLITKIDLIENDILWENKGLDNEPPIPSKWAEKIFDKVWKMEDARLHLPGYENAPMGFRFGKPPSSDMREAITATLSDIKGWRPDLDIRVEWGDGTVWPPVD